MISEAALDAIIAAEQKLEEKLFARPHYLREFEPFLPRKEMLVLTGVRRSGKSTLMKLLVRELLEKRGVSPDRVAYVNLEDYRLTDSAGPELLQKILESRKPGKRAYLFLDEIQVVPGWERWARTVYDAKGVSVKLVVSGSNASLLGKEYSTTLTGRNVTFRVRPLSYSEYLDFGKGRRSLEDYLRYGGFPEVVLAERPSVKRKLLGQYFEDIVNKDVINRHSIRNARQVYVLARYLAANVGRKTSFNRLAKSFGFPSTETVLRYTQYLKDTFLFSEVPFHSYSIKVRHDPSKLPKYYSCDNGIISILEDPSSPDKGMRLENAVFLALEGRGEVTYWAGKNEVDFIIGSSAVNVTSAQRPLAREFDGLKELAASDKQIRRLIIVAPAKHAMHGIKVIRPEDFLKNPSLRGSNVEGI